MRSADGALWVTGVRPRGKDFSLDPTRRVDTGGWFRINGTVRAGKGLVWIEGATIERAQPVQEAIVEVPAPPLPVAPLEILFSAPVEGEADVRLDSRIRIQFSRDVDPASLDGRIRLSYSRSDSFERGEAQPPAIEVAITYSGPNRSLEIRPRQPLERFRQVTVQLLEGIKGPDGAPLRPWTLTFNTGGY